ncbi:3130_t:CDS:2 [Ambispora leptoticha]|uniref:3130_t:CDS:1 n=1 Tax=Ambispora leptoticha TaxID=144679 RepID=A0A9N8YR67_9GLOM|nr:3130_t:CDS:2 [Ambispora leptoticha]
MASSSASSSKAPIPFVPKITNGISNNSKKDKNAISPSLIFGNNRKIKLDGADIRCRNCKVIKAQFEEIIRADEDEMFKLQDIIGAKLTRISELERSLREANDVSVKKDHRIRELENSVRDLEYKIIVLEDYTQKVQKGKNKQTEERERGGVSNDSEFSSDTANSVANAIRPAFADAFSSTKENNRRGTDFRNTSQGNRVYIGGVSPDVKKPRLKKCLEATFKGRVVEIDIVPFKVIVI